YSVGWLVAYLTVLLLIAEPIRNTGKYTMADVLAYRMSAGPVRSAAAISTLTVSGFYMIAQMVGAGSVLHLLVPGFSFKWAVVIVGVLMIGYVVLGGMIATVSRGMALIFGTAGLPHILMRFYTVPTARAARTSVGWAMGLIGAFYVMTTFLGFGAAVLVGKTGIGTNNNLAAPKLAEFLGGGPNTFGGELFLGFISAVAFATILAVVAGLTL